jgi:GT2 family glycosyltransferase
MNKRLFSNKKIYAVFITYANRAHFLEKSVSGAYKAGINNIIVVDNYSEKSSQEIIGKMEKLYGDKLEIIHLEKNRGSAGGFKAGLELILNKKNCEFVWLLDDDCVPEKDSLNILLEFWKNHKLDNKEENMALIPWRITMIEYRYKTKKELELKNLEKSIMNLNSFCFFSLDKLMTNIIEMMKKKKNENNCLQYIRTIVSPYGGLFFNKKLLRKVGLPKDKFFLYFDDTEFTYRMYKKFDVHIMQIPKSEIRDLEVSITNANIPTYFSVFKIINNLHKIDERKLFYEHRNRTYIEKHYLITNKTKYEINKFIFLYLIYPVLYFIYLLMFRETKKISLLKKAALDGIKVKL